MPLSGYDYEIDTLIAWHKERAAQKMAAYHSATTMQGASLLYAEAKIYADTAAYLALVTDLQRDLWHYESE